MSRLSGANLTKASLACTNFGLADLTKSNLGGSNLERASFNGANLSETILSNCICASTAFAEVDLSSTIGLEQIDHKGPSPVTFDTISRSYGKIPEHFLRGCGLSDLEIAFAKLYDPDLKNDKITTIGYEIINARIGTTVQFFSVFISYSHADKDFAKMLHDTLQNKGIRCWLDEHQLLPGDDVYEGIDRGIKFWDKLLLCCSQKSLASSWWVDSEIEKAFAKEQQLFKERNNKIRVLVPLDLDGFLHQWPSGKASVVRTRIAADFQGCPADQVKFNAEIERLIKALRTDDGGREPPPPQRL